MVQTSEADQEHSSKTSNVGPVRFSNLTEVLESLDLMKYDGVFRNENINLGMLLDLQVEEFNEMFKDIGINSWGHRRMIRKIIEELKNPTNCQDTVESIDKTDAIVTNKPLEDIDLGMETEIIDNDDMDVVNRAPEHDDNYPWFKECELCENTTQHFCSLCGEKVCNLYCSEMDPNTSNEMIRRHKPNDPRCKITSFECPSCDESFHEQSNLGSHIAEKHDEASQMLSLVSEADDSSWQYVSCNECNFKFQNEIDLELHKERFHEYGESFEIYPCEECGFRSGDIVLLQKHIKEEHGKPLYSKRIIQNLKDINFEDDSEEEGDWSPDAEDEKLLEEEEDEGYITNKRKRISDTSDENVIKKDTKRQKVASNICVKCKKIFSRKDSLKRHERNVCKVV